MRASGGTKKWCAGAAHTIALAMGVLVVGVGPALAQGGCEPTVWNLTAGQDIDVGSVTVTNDNVNIYVTYTLDYPGATLGELHLWIGSDLANLPRNPQGIPVPGQFCQADGGACFDASGLTTYTFTIPFADLGFPDISDICDTDLYIVTHAEVTGSLDETAWGGGIEGDGVRWWFYGLYTVCCDPTTPPTNDCETAFAKGGWVWTTQHKSNPEDLPSLELTRNRWGWAINLFNPGVTTYDIWAGAGLNDTSKGTLVGQLTVDWDGANAVVIYEVFGGATLSEVHLYAGDGPPTTIAPGQYGYLDSPDSWTYTFNVPLADTDGDGVWLIAHAVVCSD